MRSVKKGALWLMTVGLVVLSLPAPAVLAQGTTVEINNGNPITLKAGQTIAASTTSGIPVSVKNIPTVLNGLSAPDNGLAGFRFDFSWNKNVISVDSAHVAKAAGWTMILPGTVDNNSGTLTSAGIMTTYSTADVTLLYLGITAVGNAGASTSINVTITSLGDKDGKPIAATPVNATATIVSQAAGAGTTQGLELVSMAVTPLAPSITVGRTQQFAAIGTYSNKSSADITDTVTWSSSNEAIATIGATGTANSGRATARAAGTTTITATLGKVSASTTLTVTAAAEAVTTPPPSEEKEVTPPPSEEKKVTPPPASGAEKPATTTPPGEKKPATAPASPTLPPSEAPLPPPAASLKTINWWLVGSIAAGVVILGLISVFLLRRRTGAY